MYKKALNSILLGLTGNNSIATKTPKMSAEAGVEVVHASNIVVDDTTNVEIVQGSIMEQLQGMCSMIASGGKQL